MISLKFHPIGFCCLNQMLAPTPSPSTFFVGAIDDDDGGGGGVVFICYLHYF